MVGVPAGPTIFIRAPPSPDSPAGAPKVLFSLPPVPCIAQRVLLVFICGESGLVLFRPLIRPHAIFVSPAGARFARVTPFTASHSRSVYYLNSQRDGEVGARAAVVLR